MHYEVKPEKSNFKVVRVQLTKSGWSETLVIKGISEKQAWGIKGILDGKPVYVGGERV